MSKIPIKVREAYLDLPNGWKLEKLKFFVSVRNSNVDKKISDDEIPVLLCNYTDVYYNERIIPDMPFMEGSATKDEIKNFQLKFGQVIITKDSESWDDIGVPAFVTKNMPNVLCGYHLAILSPGPELDGNFLAWLCRADPLNDQFKLAANGVTRFGLGQYPIKNAYIAIPPLPVQQRIALFLDEKTARIDALIEKKQLLLERLAEKRQALITRAVTKGLGQQENLFENWVKTSVGKYCDVQLGKMLQSNPSSEHDELKPYLRAINISKNGLDLSHEFKMWIRPVEAVKFRLKKNDVLVSEGGDAGRTAIFDAEGEYYFQNAINRVRPNHNKKITYKFIFYWFTHLKNSGYVEMVCNVATIPHFTAEKVKAAPLTLPPLETQNQITQFLDKKTTQIDHVSRTVENSIEFLQEYRSALITAAITGQLAIPEKNGTISAKLSAISKD